MGTATFNTKNPSLEVELTVSATLNDRADVARYIQKFFLLLVIYLHFTSSNFPIQVRFSATVSHLRCC